MPTPKNKFLVTELHRKTVRKMSSFGITQDEIAQCLGIDPKTMRRHFRAELDEASTEANSKVAEALFNNATKKGNVIAQIFWMKTRARWRENHEPVDASANSGPVTKVVVEIQDPAKVRADRAKEAERNGD